jgi:hypothetical protein
MKTTMPLSKLIRALVAQTEELLDKEILLMRNPEAVPGGTLIDSYSYNVDKNIIVFPSNYIGLLKDFVISHHCINLLIKGAAAKTTGYKICSFDQESVYRGMHQIYLDALKDEAKKEKKLPVNKLLEMLFILYMQFHGVINELPWNPIANARVYYIMTQLRKTQLYILLRDGKKDMDERIEFEDIIPRRYFVLDKAMFYARDLYLAKNLPADQLIPVINIPQMKKFDHLEVKEMLTTRWTHTAWYQSKVFGDAVLKIFEKHLTADWAAPADLEYYAGLYKTGVTLTNDLLDYMTMKDWFIWETPKHLVAARSYKEEYEKNALKRIFGDLIADQL